MESLRLVSAVFVTWLYVMCGFPGVFGSRRAIVELNAFKDYVTQTMGLMTLDILTLSDKVDELARATPGGSRDGKMIDDVASRDIQLDKETDISSQKRIIDDLLKKNNDLLRAFQTEKLLNRQLQGHLNLLEGRFDKISGNVKDMNDHVEELNESFQEVKVNIVKVRRTTRNRFESLEDSVADRFNELTVNMTSLKNSIMSIDHECDDNIQTIRKYVNRIGENIGQVADNVKGITKHGQAANGNVQSVSEKVHALNETVQSVSKPVDKVSKTQICKAVPKSGVYDIYVESVNANFPMYCDQDTDGGGWIVVLRRKDGSENFTRSWKDYREGFGDREGEFWAGNGLMYILTESKQAQLRIDMEYFDGKKVFAQYEKFQIGPEEDKYRLSVSGYSGTAGDSLTEAEHPGGVHDGYQFRTFDADTNMNCAATYKGGWWFNQCFFSHLTGVYRPTGKTSNYRGIIWHSWTGYTTSLKFVEMKIRPV